MAELSTKVKTGKVRFSYAHVFTPTSVEEGGEKKYSVSILIDKKDKVTLKRIKDAVKAAEADLKVKCNGKLPKNYKTPLRDGDDEREDDENYEGMMFLNASSKSKPGVVDRDREELFDDEDFYSGCWGRAVLNMYAFNVSGNKGIAAGLNNLQKLEEGEKLGGGGSSAAEDFADDYEDDDMLD